MILQTIISVVIGELASNTIASRLWSSYGNLFSIL